MRDFLPEGRLKIRLICWNTIENCAPIFIGILNSQSAGKSVIIKAMALSQTQELIVAGLLLGDGYLEFDKFKASRLQIKQAECKKEYVFWLYTHFADKVRTAPKQRLDTRQWYFSTRSLRELELWRKMFYPNGKKIVPENIIDLVTNPITLAVWFMDDGVLDYRIHSHYSFTLSTDAFNIAEVRLLQHTLLKNFGIESSIQTPSSRGTKYTKLYIGKNGRERFLETIKPHMLECFGYKMPPQFNLTPQRLISMQL